jgi:hybrid cluster-associated redox disulfide protein
MTTITKDMTISEVLQLDVDAAMVFFESGMHCVGCPSAAGETIEEASAVHGIDSDDLVDKLNKYFEEKETTK